MEGRERERERDGVRLGYSDKMISATNNRINHVGSRPTAVQGLIRRVLLSNKVTLLVECHEERREDEGIDYKNILRPSRASATYLLLPNHDTQIRTGRKRVTSFIPPLSHCVHVSDRYVSAARTAGGGDNGTR